MKVDIPYYIRQVLREQRMVNVPGLGMFLLEQTPSRFNDDKTILSPPSLNIRFNDEDSDDESLLKYILDTGHCSEDKASKKIEEYTQAAFNKILNVDSFLIDGIGRLAKRDGHDKVEFEPQLSKLTREYSDLIPIDLKPITRIAEKNSIVNGGNVINTPLEESGSFLPRIILLSALLICCWFFGNYINDNYFNKQDDSEIGTFKENGNNNSSSIGIDTEVENPSGDAKNEQLKQKYQEIDELIEPITESEISGQDSKLDEELSNLSNKEVVKPTKEINQATPKETANTNEDKNNGIGIPVTIKKIAELENKPNSKNANKHSDIIPESGECIIIVGSFIKSINAVNMIDLLQRKGFKVYRGEYNGFTRVGLKYDCANEDLEEFLHDIRYKISRRAWYLDPDLDVDYRF